MPHANKAYIRRKLIVVTIKQHKPNGLWQAGILFSISSETPSQPPPKRGRIAGLHPEPVEGAKIASLCNHKTKKAVDIFYLPTAYIKRKNRINQ
jgi:hypothetical protein